MPTTAQMRRLMIDFKTALEKEQKVREAAEMTARIKQLFGTRKCGKDMPVKKEAS